MRISGENEPPMSRRLRRCAFPVFLLNLAVCPGCYEHVVGGNSAYAQKSAVHEPNVDKDKGAFEQFADDVFGGDEKKRK